MTRRRMPHIHRSRVTERERGMTRKPNTIGAALLVALLVALTAGCGGGGDDKNAGATARGDELTRVKLAYLGVASDAAMLLGRDKGFFKQEGIDLQLSRVGAGGAAVVPALLKGDVDVASGGIDGPILAAAKGLDVKILAANGAPISKGHTHPAGTKRGTTGIVVPADSPVRSYKDLAGKTVGAITVSGLQYLCVAGAVEKAGADPKSVRVVEIEAPDMLAEVKQHHVAAAAVVEPFPDAGATPGLPRHRRPVRRGDARRPAGGLLHERSVGQAEPGGRDAAVARAHALERVRQRPLRRGARRDPELHQDPAAGRAEAHAHAVGHERSQHARRGGGRPGQVRLAQEAAGRRQPAGRNRHLRRRGGPAPRGVFCPAGAGA